MLPAGGLEVHHPYTPHSSMPNTSRSRQRRAIILRYQPLSEPLHGEEAHGSLLRGVRGRARQRESSCRPEFTQEGLYSTGPRARRTRSATTSCRLPRRNAAVNNEDD